MKFHLGNLSNEFHGGDQPYGAKAPHVARAFREAAAWLAGQALIVSDGNPGSDWMQLSRRAISLRSEQDYSAFLAASRFPRDRIHASIADDTWSEFIRGNYATAVFVAMRQVEIAVRKAGGYGPKVIGVELMRQAFHPDKGPLRDPETESGERDARMHLFAGAIGAYKNPPSHREVDMNDPDEAMEVILLASHLLRIVEARAPSG
ncbi:MAG: TIGR02391 family protein [Rhizobiaceae bacterium]|nr:TIGR02391 family protein [Rhizobiaceae bacterium]